MWSSEVLKDTMQWYGPEIPSTLMHSRGKVLATYFQKYNFMDCSVHFFRGPCVSQLNSSICMSNRELLDLKFKIVPIHTFLILVIQSVLIILQFGIDFTCIEHWKLKIKRGFQSFKDNSNENSTTPRFSINKTWHSSFFMQRFLYGPIGHSQMRSNLRIKEKVPQWFQIIITYVWYIRSRTWFLELGHCWICSELP